MERERIGYPELEEIIRRVRGVVSARVLRGKNEGEISEIHVVAGPGRNPKQLVRDIESAVMVQLGLAVDHRKISVVQLEMEAPTDFLSSAYGLPPVTVTGISYRVRGRQARAEVELDIGGTQFVGVESGALVPGCAGTLAAAAVLRAVEAYLQEKEFFRLADAFKVEIAHRQAWLVAVETSGGIQLGAALVGRDELEAAVEATLTAVCRSPVRPVAS